MKISLIHWHIEVSSICTLKCPRCPRSEIPETLLNNQLTLDFFIRQLGEDTIKQIKKITFCGDDGDPIYAKEFLEICQWIKLINPMIHLVIVTNGSYKKEKWWVKLACILNKYDEIQWSLDGWDQTSNEQYRVNCDWASIIRGIDIFKKNNVETYTTIATIVFKFNEKNLDNIKRLAEHHEIDCWQLTRSTKFGSVYPEVYGLNDPLEPGPEYVADGHRFDRWHNYLTDKRPPSDVLKKVFQAKADEVLMSDEYSALCYVGTKGIYLKANGELYPCCWTANRYEHNKDIIAVVESRFNLNNRTLDKILQDEWWTTDFLKFDNLECRTKCTKDNFTEQFVTEW